jgi:hypothetical protein
MIEIDKILEYVPTDHGEHGVDSVIHRSILKKIEMHEAYSNPPGASWAEITIQNPTSKEFFSWDHIPREPKCAKRPDAIIQFNKKNTVNLLILESKGKISDIYKNMDKLLKEFFKGNINFNGLFNRPTQHRKNPVTEKWEFIGNNTSLDTYWIQKIQSKINLYSGFAFGFEPEFYDEIESFDKEKWEEKMEKLKDEHSLDIVIGIGWHGVQHTPFVNIVVSENFSQTEFYSQLKSSLI